MFTPGLVSITFRQLTPQRIVELVGQAGLAAIEWGGDVHVPHGDVEQARRVGRLTRDAGLAVAAYGSYYRVGHGEPVPFGEVLATAVELGAPRVRVWAGKVGSGEADESYWRAVVEDARAIAESASAAGVGVVFEYHPDTLTDTPDSAVRLLRAVGHPNVRSYWQPSRLLSAEERLAGLRSVLDWLGGLHVYQWDQAGRRCPLAEGQAAWRDYLRLAATAPATAAPAPLPPPSPSQGEGPGVRVSRRPDAPATGLPALLEFVPDDDPAAFLRDAATLKQWLAEP